MSKLDIVREEVFQAIVIPKTSRRASAAECRFLTADAVQSDEGMHDDFLEPAACRL